jgi:hypothetical protein
VLRFLVLCLVPQLPLEFLRHRPGSDFPFSRVEVGLSVFFRLRAALSRVLRFFRARVGASGSSPAGAPPRTKFRHRPRTSFAQSSVADFLRVVPPPARFRFCRVAGSRLRAAAVRWLIFLLSRAGRVSVPQPSCRASCSPVPSSPGARHLASPVCFSARR